MGKLFDQAKAEVEKHQRREDELEKQQISNFVEDILGSEWVPLLDFSPSPIHHATLDQTICIYVTDSKAYFYPLCPSCRKNAAIYESYGDQRLLSWEAIVIEVERAKPCRECARKDHS